MPFFETLFLLLCGHAVADFVLQPEAMGKGKNRHSEVHSDEQELFPSWHYWLSAHSLVHGGAVYLITNNIVLGITETIVHGIIDFAKCEGWIGMHQDQALHIGAKVAYAVAIYYFIGGTGTFSGI